MLWSEIIWSHRPKPDFSGWGTEMGSFYVFFILWQIAFGNWYGPICRLPETIFTAILHHSLPPQNKCFLIRANLVRIGIDPDLDFYSDSDSSPQPPAHLILSVIMPIHKYLQSQVKHGVSAWTNLGPFSFPPSCGQTSCHRGGSGDADTTCIAKLPTRWDNMGALIGD